jgi:hypothetical protein
MAEYEPTEAVKQWTQITLDLINAAGGYAATGVEDPNMSAMIRQLKVTTAALMAALQTIK